MSGCGFLKEGQLFESRRCIEEDSASDRDRCVRVRLQECDIEKGYVCGDISGKEGSVVRFWEGEIIDNRNYSFHSSKWVVDWEAHDSLYWNAMDEFGPLREEVENDGGASLDLEDYPHMFMRWKEHFPNVLTEPGWIPRLHHVCFVKSDGRLIISRYHFPDRPLIPAGSRVELLPRFPVGLSGYNFATYQFQ